MMSNIQLEMNHEKKSQKKIRVVGIGGSAGSLNSIRDIFNHIPATNGLAYVVIQHLPIDHKTHMDELLSKRTNMKVCIAEDQMKVEANCIYLTPPQTHITIQNGRFQLQPFNKEQKIHFPIDVFFTSLSKEIGEEAIVVVLSGYGKDGTKGVKAVYDAGGTVIVQSVESAKFEDMPRHAIETELADHVLTVEEIGELLGKIGGPSTKELHYVSFDNAPETDAVLEQICALIFRKSGIDFSYYKKNSLLRRIEKRVNLNQLKFQSIEEYKEYLIKNPEELVQLQKDMLINVTQFFRDKEAFSVIEKKIVREIVTKKVKNGETEIRIWIPGCSTGEEAYSIAILFREYLKKANKEMVVKIFATDLDKDAISIASSGVYDQNAVLSLDPKRLNTYFNKDGLNYKIKSNIREMVIFAPHNIATDSPFVNLDFISCRNMLIYFQPNLQKKVLSMFHFALKKEGYLFLGPSESVGVLSNLYEMISHKWKIFKNIDGENVKEYSNSPLPRKISSDSLDNSAQKTYKDVNTLKMDSILNTLIENYSAPFLIINEENNVIMSGGQVNEYLKIPQGNMSINILRMLPANLSVTINTAIKKVRKERQKVEYSNVRIYNDNEDLVVNVSVQPFIIDTSSRDNLIIVLIEAVNMSTETKTILKDLSFNIDNNIHQLIEELENELSYTRERLQTTIEELETSNEEYQSTNEELIAANEEMQSSNEELQSVNEELHNVNAEHEIKIRELIDLNNDMDNFLISTNIATIFLDEELKIKRFTPKISELFNIMDVDVGRPLAHFSTNFLFEQLIEDAQDVLTNHHRMMKEVETKDGRWFSIRTHPYRTSENFVRGVVISFLDITTLKKANEELKIRSFAIEQSPASTAITDIEGKIHFVNTKFMEQLSYTKEEIVGKELVTLFTNKETVEEFERFWPKLLSGETWSGDCMVTDRDGNEKWEAVKIIPITNSDGEIYQFLRIAEDITERKKAEDLLRKSEMLSALGELAAGIAHEIRNPLTALKGFIQLMQTEEGANQSYLSIMLSEFDRIETIINELLVLARPHAVEYEEKMVTHILKDVVMLLETQAIMNNVTIKADLNVKMPAIKCVEKELKQVFINLIKNSIEAMPDGGNITIHSSVTKDQHVRLLFKDEGKGIPKERLEKLGQPFYTTKDKGTGLGLMVSFKIIENHHGVMEFSSELNKGTTVEIKLPIR